MSNPMTILVQEIIDSLLTQIEDEDLRHAVYEDMMVSLESSGINFPDVLGFDPIFDQVYYENNPEIEDE